MSLVLPKISKLNFLNLFLILILPLPFTTLGLYFFSVGDFYLPELFILFWLILLFFSNGKEYLRYLTYKNFLILFLILTGISIFSLSHLDFDFKAFYGRFRALLFGLLAFTIILNMRKNFSLSLNNNLIIFLYSSSVMYFIVCLLSIYSGGSKLNISMICFSILCVALIELKKYNQAFWVSVLSALVAFLSFWRQNYIIAFFLIITTLIFVICNSIFIKNNKIYLSKSLISILGFFSITMYFIFSNIQLFSNFLSSSESRYKQSIGKTMDIFDQGDDGSASVRAESINYILDNIFYFMLPNGIINDSSISSKSIWGGEKFYLGLSIVRDSGFAYFLITFGWLICLLVFTHLLSIYIRYGYLNYKLNFLRIIFITPSLLAIFFLDGLSLTQIQKIIFLGIGLAMIYPMKFKEKYI